MFRPMNELVERNLVPLVHRLLADYASRKLLSPLGSRECVTEMGTKERSHPRVLAPVRGMLGPLYSDQYAPPKGWRCWPRQTVEDALRLKVTRDWSTFCILQAADYAK
jgi:hypothetical protein